ncbi:acyl-CoA hydrolase [Lysobacter enzymogenes]|uniref:nuclear transport factor 2 family protein n=1 Tax=Lysobacter enzymogenes TaxID=69 RepID=UPI0033952462
MTASTPLRLLAAALATAASTAFADTPTPAPTPTIDPATRTAIEATCFDYLDGQLEGDPERVARSLHPDLAKRRALGETADEKLGLRRMSKEELVDLTRRGALKTPKAQWNRSCTALDVAGNAAVARAETPWFVDFFHLGKFGDRWIIVNALWYSKPKPEQQ